MNKQPEHNISSERATDLLKDEQPLLDFYIEGKLEIETIENWDKEVIIENCIIEYLSGCVTHFNKQVRLINCHFKNCQFVSSFFLGGLTIENCTFDNYLDFQSGGHNQVGNSVIITNNDFKDFVNFFDCWFENEVTISYNNFHKGTNLFGKPFNIPVRYDKEPIIEQNIGNLDIDNEGIRNE